jgi:hypothetical protein
MGEHADHSRDEVEGKVARAPNPAFDIIAEDAEKEHVARQVHETRMGELTREKGEQAFAKRYFRWHDSQCQGAPGIGAEALDEYKNGDIYRDDGPGDDSFASSAGILVADRYHSVFPQGKYSAKPGQRLQAKRGGRPPLKPSRHPCYNFSNDESLDVRSRQYALFREERHGAEGSRKNQ